MRAKHLGWILGSVMAAAPTSAWPMSAAEQGSCRLLQAEKLPRDAGGADAICAIFDKAIAAKAPKLRYTAEVQVLSKAALSAKVVADGRVLAERRLAVMDKNLNAGSIQRFAEALATEVARVANS